LVSTPNQGSFHLGVSSISTYINIFLTITLPGYHHKPGQCKHGQEEVRNSRLRDFGSALTISQPEDKKGDSSPIPSIAKKETVSDYYLAILLGVAAVVFIVGWSAYVTWYLAPADAKKNLQREAEHQASIDGPKVLLELVGEMRLLRSELSHLRSAVENLAAR
jgi:hypothetical protein